MATFRFGRTVPSISGAFESAALGASTSTPLTDLDLGKALKLASSNNYVVASDGDDLEAVLVAVSPHTVNNGFGFGTVERRFTELEAVVVEGGGVAVGDAVICAAQTAVGTAQTVSAAPKIKKGAGTLFKWRVKSLLTGAGANGTVVLIEPITR